VQVSGIRFFTREVRSRGRKDERPRTCSGRGYNDSDIDLIGGDGQQSSSNKDRLSGKSTPALSSAMTTEMIQGPWTWIKRIRELEKEAMYIL
jgi:hypothetical protein